MKYHEGNRFGESDCNLNPVIQQQKIDQSESFLPKKCYHLQTFAFQRAQKPSSLRACKANPAGDISSFIFTVCAKPVPLYHFKFAYVVLHIAVKEFFETHF